MLVRAKKRVSFRVRHGERGTFASPARTSCNSVTQSGGIDRSGVGAFTFRKLNRFRGNAVLLVHDDRWLFGGQENMTVQATPVRLQLPGARCRFQIPS